MTFLFSLIFPLHFILSTPIEANLLSDLGWLASESLELKTTKITISVDFQRADIHEVIRFFSKATGVNFVVSEGVSGTVTARLIDVPWEDALQAILASRGLAAQNMGSLMLIK